MVRLSDRRGGRPGPLGLAALTFGLAVATAGCSTTVETPAATHHPVAQVATPSVTHPLPPIAPAELHGNTSGDTSAYPPFATVERTWAADAALLHDASERVVADCMGRRGFRYTPDPYPSAKGSAQWHVGDVAFAAEHGYAIDYGRRPGAAPGVPEGPGTGDDTAHAADTALLTPVAAASWREALIGRPIDPSRPSPDVLRVPGVNGETRLMRLRTCATEGLEAVRGDLSTWFAAEAAFAQTQRQVAVAVSADPDFQQADARWAACLRRAGYPDPGREAAAQRLRTAVAEGALSPERARAAERARAVADATCMTTEGTTITINTLTARHEKALPDESRRAVRDMESRHAAAVHRATNLVGTPWPVSLDAREKGPLAET